MNNTTHNNSPQPGPARGAASAVLVAAAMVLGAPFLQAESNAPEDGREHFPIATTTLQARHEALFARADGDGDGQLTFTEFASFEPGPGAQRRGPHPERQHSRHRREGINSGNKVDEDVLFAALDEDGDGVLSAAEFSRDRQREARRELHKQQLFSRLDANDDSVLTPDEFPPRDPLELDADADGEITREEFLQGSHHRQRQAG